MATNMPWFKLFSESRTDKKLATLNDSEFRVWFNLLCYAAEQNTRGSFDYDDEFTLSIEVSNGDVELMQTTISKLEKLRIVTIVTSCNEKKRVVIAFIHFDERQKRKTSPSDAPEKVYERVKKHRNNSVTSNSERVTNVTSVKRPEVEEEVDTDDITKPALRKSGVLLDVDLLQGSQEFYDRYGHKKDPEGFKKQWIATSKVRPPNSELLPIVDKYKAFCLATGISQKYPGAWLKDRRWLEDNTIPNKNGQTPNSKPITSYTGREAI